MFDLDIRSLAAELLNMSKERGFTVATVESCTGGLVCGALTTVAGPSGTRHRERRFGERSRDEIRRLSVLEALDLLRETVLTGP